MEEKKIRRKEEWARSPGWKKRNKEENHTGGCLRKEEWPERPEKIEKKNGRRARMEEKKRKRG